MKRGDEDVPEAASRRSQDAGNDERGNMVLKNKKF
jgi:hypothetical protein